MSVRNICALRVLLIVVWLAAGAGTPPAAAGADACPEPNDSFATACDLAPGSTVQGFIDTPADVDGYRIQLPAGSMVAATLGALPAEYGLRLLLPDASIKAEAVEPGTGDRIVQVDGLAAGTYYLAVFSPRGAATLDLPYALSVDFPASAILTAPTRSAAQPGAEFVPPPAKNYGLSPADVGDGFREIERDEEEGGSFYRAVMLAPDARLESGTLFLSRTRVSQVVSMVFLEPYGSDEQTTRWFNELLESLRAKYGANVQPAHGWGSEQVYSYAWAEQGIFQRGIALKHRNSAAFVETIGQEHLATWAHASGLMRRVESRIRTTIAG